MSKQSFSPSSAWLVAAMLVVLNAPISTHAFTSLPSAVQLSSNNIIASSLDATAAKGMGMGMGTKKKNGKKGKASAGNSKGMGGGKTNGSTQSTSFDAAASLLRLEKKYGELQQADNKAMAKSNSNDDADADADKSGSMRTSEMVVTVRAVPSKSAATADWVPVAQLCLHPHSEVSSEFCQAAISLHCRELSFAATLGSKLFASVPRQDLQYAIEPVDSFYKHVYDPVIESQLNDDNKNSMEDGGGAVGSMTKAEARLVLEIQVPDTNDTEAEQKSQIKQAYRKKSFTWHPDRLEKDLAQSDVDHAAHQYARIQKAYETLNSGIRSATTSWYASLGGRERTDFRVVELMGRDDASSILERFRVQSAVTSLDPALPKAFTARHQASSKQQQTQTTTSSTK